MSYQGTNKKRLTPAEATKELADIDKRLAARRQPTQKEVLKALPPLPKLPKPPSVKPEDLPLVSVVESQAIMTELIDLMQTDVHLVEEIAAMTELRDVNKKRAAVILLDAGLPGVRYGTLYVKVSEEEVKRTLDKGLLALQFGIDLDVMEATCYKESKPFRKVFFDDLNRPKRGRGRSGDQGSGAAEE